jgi:hypothetical protein
MKAGTPIAETQTAALDEQQERSMRLLLLKEGSDLTREVVESAHARGRTVRSRTRLYNAENK